MKIKNCWKTIFTLFLLSNAAMAADDISGGNYVDVILASAKGTSTSHFVQWKNPINANCPRNRTRFSVEDKEIMSLLLAAKVR